MPMYKVVEDILKKKSVSNPNKTIAQVILDGTVTKQDLFGINTTVAFPANMHNRLKIADGSYSSQEAMMNFVRAIGPHLSDRNLQTLTDKLIEVELTEGQQAFRTSTLAKAFVLYQIERHAANTPPGQLPEPLLKNMQKIVPLIKEHWGANLVANVNKFVSFNLIENIPEETKNRFSTIRDFYTPVTEYDQNKFNLESLSDIPPVNPDQFAIQEKKEKVKAESPKKEKPESPKKDKAEPVKAGEVKQDTPLDYAAASKQANAVYEQLISKVDKNATDKRLAKNEFLQLFIHELEYSQKKGLSKDEFIVRIMSRGNTAKKFKELGGRLPFFAAMENSKTVRTLIEGILGMNTQEMLNRYLAFPNKAALMDEPIPPPSVASRDSSGSEKSITPPLSPPPSPPSPQSRSSSGSEKSTGKDYLEILNEQITKVETGIKKVITKILEPNSNRVAVENDLVDLRKEQKFAETSQFNEIEQNAKTSNNVGLKEKVSHLLQRYSDVSTLLANFFPTRDFLNMAGTFKDKALSYAKLRDDSDYDKKFNAAVTLSQSQPSANPNKFFDRAKNKSIADFNKKMGDKPKGP